MKKFSFLFLSIIILVLSSCNKHDELPSVSDAWFHADSYNGNVTFYLNFRDNGEINFKCRPSSDRFWSSVYYSNSGTYLINDNNITFNLQSSTMINGNWDVLTPQDDYSHVTVGRFVEFISGVWENGMPQSYNECFSNDLTVQYRAATIINGKIYEWTEHEAVFTGAVKDPSEYD